MNLEIYEPVKHLKELNMILEQKIKSVLEDYGN